MNTINKLITLCFGAGLAYSAVGANGGGAVTNPKVRMTTSAGIVDIELDAKRAPTSTENFLKYVDQGAYDGTIFHRVIPRFMIQGGGFTPDMKQKPTGKPIKNEADNGLKNTAGTIAMARTGDPHSATAQFFINTVDNPFLDHRDKSTQGWGYTVFGKVTSGMDVVKKIEAAPTGNRGMHQNVPREDVVIQKIERINAAK
jgi:cyclophilin family peptidyl-prolyl cis-trans isomerase